MNNGLTIILLLVIGCTIGSFGALFLKLGSKKFRVDISIKGIINIIRNYRLILGIFLYGLSSVFFLMALKIGELSVVYPLTSMTYIFVAILSVWILKEKLNKWKIFGIVMIIIGVILVRL